MLIGEDVPTAKGHLDQALGDPTKEVICVIRGTGTEVEAFAEKARIRADAFPWREAVRVRLDEADWPAVFGDHDWFAGHATACSVFLNAERKPCEWLDDDAEGADIEFAFLDVKSA
jgi:hypothetical protein